MIILASSSQRRVELLKDAGIDFKVIPSEVKEVFDSKLTPEENVMNIARLKALDVYEKNKDAVIIAADTAVIYKNEIFGKPTSKEDAFNMLMALNNNTHDVITGVAIIDDSGEDVFYSKAQVTFKNLTEEEINNYIETEEPIGKAGAYAIQGLGKELVETYTGDFFTIVGLPLKEVLEKIAIYKWLSCKLLF